MFPENISKNFEKVRQIAFSDLPIEEKMRLFDEFDDLMVFYKDNITFVKNCFLPIEGFEDYAVNPFGNVISCKGDFVRLLSKCHNSVGYLKVNLCRDGKSVTKKNSQISRRYVFTKS